MATLCPPHRYPKQEPGTPFPQTRVPGSTLFPYSLLLPESILLPSPCIKGTIWLRTG